MRGSRGGCDLVDVLAGWTDRRRGLSDLNSRGGTKRPSTILPDLSRDAHPAHSGGEKPRSEMANDGVGRALSRAGIPVCAE